MKREPLAYLSDILESCEAIDKALLGLQIKDYLGNRLVRSSVEREFTIIGEAVLALSHNAPAIYSSITGARRIIDLRNRLTHEYPSVDDELIWGLAKGAMQILKVECQALLSEREEAAGSPDWVSRLRALHGDQPGP